MPPNRDSNTDTKEPAFGPYEILERLGIGGMATVHRAREQGIAGFQRIVALKRLLPHLAEDEVFVRAFVREAKLASMLQHANIAQLYELGRVGNEYFISMELVEGRDVRQILRQARAITGPPPIGVTVALLSQVCDALEYAHSRTNDRGEPLGIVHRDVSPSNILVSAAGHVKIIDFGIAKASVINLRTQSGRVKGKTAYMSPEAAQGLDLDSRSDVFSTGVIAHELVTARPLFATQNDYKTLTKVQNAKVVAPSSYNPDCPPELDAIILQALDKDRDRRFQHAADMQRALDELSTRVQLNASSSEVAGWMQWAFALEQPITNRRQHRLRQSNVNGSQSSSIRIGDCEPRRGSYAELTAKPVAPPGDDLPTVEADEEVMEFVWGGRTPRQMVPVIVDGVPDVSSRSSLPAPPPRTARGTKRPPSPAQPTATKPPPPPTDAVSGISRSGTNGAGRLALPLEAPAESTPVTGTANTRTHRSQSAEPKSTVANRSPKSRSFQWARGSAQNQILSETHARPSALTPGEPPKDSPAASLGEQPSVGHKPPGGARAFGANVIENQKPRGIKTLIWVAAAAIVGATAIMFVSGKDLPPPARAKTTTKFLVEPADAIIVLEGHKAHQGSPWNVDLEAGSYRIEVRKKGYRSWVSSFEVIQGEKQAIRVALDRGGSDKASIVVRSTPPGKRVYIDEGSIDGVTPMNLELHAGRHILSIRDRNGELWRHEFVAVADTKYDFHPVLARKSRRGRRSNGGTMALAAQASTNPILEFPNDSESGSADTGRGTAEAPLPALEMRRSKAFENVKPPPIVRATKPKSPAAPVIVPPGIVKKLSGRVPPLAKRRGSAAPTRISAKVCIDDRGEVTKAEMITRLPEHERRTLVGAIRRWRYRPYIPAGRPVAACFAVSFRTAR